MLVLSRNPLEELLIGDQVRLVILEVTGNRVRLGISAPSEVPVYREEVCVPSRGACTAKR